MFWRRLVFATQGFIRYIPRGILARQTEVDEIINGRTLGPGVSLRSTLKVPITIDFDRMETVRIHFRRAKHYIVGRAIATKSFILKKFLVYNKVWIPYRWAMFRSCINRMPYRIIH